MPLFWLTLPQNKILLSHGNERHQKDCLNCGAEIHGHYCHICGQQNLEPKESAWALISHFVYDITHFDGKFFSSLKFLLFRPGFLSQEYMRGRRASYLNPIKMYVFTSAIFFIIMLSSKKSTDFINTNGAEKNVVEQRSELLAKLKVATDSSVLKELRADLMENDTLMVTWEKIGLIEESPTLADSTRKNIQAALDQDWDVVNLGGRKLPKTIEAYDSLQKALPATERDGWMMRYFSHKGIELNAKYHGDSKEFQNKFVENIIHSIPKMMFVSLPLVAFFLQLLYIRRKQFYYVNHGILIIHIYIAAYILILVAKLFGWLNHITHYDIFNWLESGIYLVIFYYIYKSLRSFYGQSIGKTILKYSLFLLMVTILFALLGVGFAINSLLHV